MTKTLLITLTLGTVCIPMLAQSHTKETNMGAQVDVYAEYSPIEEVTISLGEEVSFTNFLATENGVFDATNTVLGVTYTPHPNIAIEAGYEFLYSNAEVMEHCVKLSAIPQVELGDFSLSLQETAQMTYSMFEKSYNWQIVSKLEVAYAIPNTPLSAYIYTEMTNPLGSITEPVAVTELVAVTEPVEVPEPVQNTPWYD
jgi:hypothetical protein